MVGRRHRRLRRLWRARQRAERGARRAAAAQRSADRRVAHGSDDHRRQHQQHAGGRARGEHLHGHHDRGVLPRPGLPRRAAGRLDQPLGRGAARGLEPARGDARRGGLSRVPREPARGVLRARGRGRVPGRRRSRRVGDDRRARCRRRAATSPSRSRSTACASPGRSGRWTRRSRTSVTSRRSSRAGATRSTTSGAGSTPRSRADWHEQRAWALDAARARGRSCRRSSRSSARTRSGRAEQVVLRTGRLLREDFLQQSAFDDRDAYCAPEKQYWMLRAIRRAHEAMDAAVGRGGDVAETTGASRRSPRSAA